MTDRSSDAESERDGRGKPVDCDFAQRYCFSVGLATRRCGETIMIMKYI
jgi:hypothetical protein